jgi:hypothetical protein
MELVEMLKNLQANVEERLRQTDQYGGEIDELFNEILNELEKPKTCETCSKWKQHSGSIFGICADGNRSHFSDEDTTYDYGCTDYRLKDSDFAKGGDSVGSINFDKIISELDPSTQYRITIEEIL